MTDELPSVTSVFRYSYKTVAAHLREIAAEPIEPVGVALGCFGSLWTVYEASVNSLKLSPNRFLPYMSFVVVALVAGLLTAFHRYINSCPEGLEAISRSAQRIAQLRRPMWEFKFAKAVLAQLIGPIDDECRDLLNGKVFVTSTPFRDFPEYFAWLTGRPENLIRMVKVAQKLI